MMVKNTLAYLLYCSFLLQFLVKACFISISVTNSVVEANCGAGAQERDCNGDRLQVRFPLEEIKF